MLAIVMIVVVVAPAFAGDDGWWDYQILMWQAQTSAGYAALKAIGLTGGKLIARENPPPPGSDEVEAALLEQNLGWYEENIATDFYAPYHRWTPGKPVNWKYLAAQALHRREPASLLPYIRDPSLSDPLWRARVRDRLTRIVGLRKAFHPLFYNLGDETGIADLAAYWDFDFSPQSLAGLRRSLKERYGTLARLNRQWSSRFLRWDDVMPLTAAAAILRRDGNYSAWADFREWMDLSFAQALAEGRDAVHAADPQARAALEGGQIPGWGGYDYALLAQAVDVLEIYDAGNNVDLVRSFNPRAAILTTSFAHGLPEKRRVWRELLLGGHGLILWDEASEFVHADGILGQRGRDAAGYFREMRGGLGALLINSARPAVPIAIHYSPASMRTDWIIRQRRKGGRALDLASRPDHPEDHFTRLRQSVCDLLADLGQQYRFVSARQVEDGALQQDRPRLLILPDSIALSPVERERIGHFLQAGGSVIAIGKPGLFDEHARRRAVVSSPALFRGATRNEGRIMAYRHHRTGLAAQALRGAWKRRLAKSGVTPLFALTEPTTGKAVDGIEVTVRQDGDVSILGLLDAASPHPQARTLRLSLPAPSCGYDLRGGTDLGCGRRFTLRLPPFEPAILALSPQPIPPFSLSLPEVAHPGETVDIRIARQGPAADAVQVFHLDVIAPDGRSVPSYSGNLRSTDGTARKSLPLALNDRTGNWTIRVIDILSGHRQETTLSVLER